MAIDRPATYGASLARFLLDAGQAVREVPPHLTCPERIRTRRPGESDPGDALAIARVMLHEPNLPVSYTKPERRLVRIAPPSLDRSQRTHRKPRWAPILQPPQQAVLTRARRSR